MSFHQLFWNLTKEKLPLHGVNFGVGAVQILHSFINNATCHPMNPDADVTYQTFNLFSSESCFVYFISDVPHYI